MIDWDNYIINENGVDHKATPEEIAERKAFLASMPPPVPSLEETVEQQAAEIADLKAALNALLERRVQ